MGTLITAAIALGIVLVLLAVAISLFLRISLKRAQERISRERVLARLHDPRFRRATNVIDAVRLDGTDEQRVAMLFRRLGEARIFRA